MGTPEFEAELAETARSLRLLAAAMAGGIGFCGFVVAVIVFKAAPAQVWDTELVVVQLLSALNATVAAAFYASAGAAYNFALAHHGAGELKALRNAEVIRLAMGEMTAMLGLAVCLIAGLQGVLRAQPAYWANAATPLLFLTLVSGRWPSEERLRLALRERFPGKFL